VDAGRAQVNVRADCGGARTISLGFDLGAWGVFGGPIGVCEGGVTGAGVVVAGAGVGGGRAVGRGSGGGDDLLASLFAVLNLCFPGPRCEIFPQSIRH